MACSARWSLETQHPLDVGAEGPPAGALPLTCGVTGATSGPGAAAAPAPGRGGGPAPTLPPHPLSPFLLTRLLLENLLRAPHARVINVSSGSHGAATATGGWQLERAGYDRKLAYAKSKLANILFTVELARRLAGANGTPNAV